MLVSIRLTSAELNLDIAGGHNIRIVRNPQVILNYVTWLYWNFFSGMESHIKNT